MKTSKENLQVYIGGLTGQEQLIKGKGECRLQHVEPSEVSKLSHTQTNHVEGDQDHNSHELGACLCIASRAVMLVTACMQHETIINN